MRHVDTRGRRGLQHAAAVVAVCATACAAPAATTNRPPAPAAAAASTLSHTDDRPDGLRTPGRKRREAVAPRGRQSSEGVGSAGRGTVRLQRQVADPVRVAVPRAGIDAPVIPLGLDEDGALEVPSHYAVAGWYRAGPEPGEAGAAVVVGHVDSRAGPAVFFRLRELRPGDRVVVRTADGGDEEFVVDRVEQHPKDRFPTAAVYGRTREPTLRLVTCGGDFDLSTGHYHDNVVVFAHVAP